MLEFSSSGASLFGSPVNASVAGMNPNQANNAMSGSSIFSQFARSNSASSGSGNSMFNLLNTGTGTLGPPPPLDMNEFPSLGGSGGTINFSQSSTAGRQPYVGLLKDNVGVAPTSNEFSIQSEDFPALPGAPSGSGHSQRPTSPTSASLHAALAHHSFGAADVVVNQLGSYSTQQISAAAGVLGTSSSASNSAGTSGTSGSNVRPDSTESSQTQSSGTGGGASGSGNNSGSGASGAAGGGKKTSGVQLTKDGHLANIPPGMLTDQYGMAGLVALLANTESNQNLFSLAIGYDISSINLNLNSKERIYQTYPGPWNEKQLKPYEIDYPVPSEYLVHHNIRDKISEFKAPTYGDDLLFFLFYFFAGEQMQVYATRELYSREWRFHKDEGVWIRRMNSHMEKNPSGTYERGSYIYFDPINWMKMQKEMTVEYDRLESQPSGFQ